MPPRALRELAETVVVTLAAEGAIAFGNGEDDRRPPASRSCNPADTTGAGDLLTAAYIWADLRGAEPEDRLQWAVLYAGLAVNDADGHRRRGRPRRRCSARAPRAGSRPRR